MAALADGTAQPADIFSALGMATAVTDGYFSNGTSPSPELVHAYLKARGAFAPYENDGQFIMTREEYGALVSAAFARPDTAGCFQWLAEKDMIDADGNVSFYLGGVGDIWAWVILTEEETMVPGYGEGTEYTGLYLLDEASLGQASKTYNGFDYAVCQIVRLTMVEGRILSFETAPECADMENGLLYSNPELSDYGVTAGKLSPITEGESWAYLFPENTYYNSADSTRHYVEEKGFAVQSTPHDLYLLEGVVFTTASGSVEVRDYTETTTEWGTTVRLYAAPEGLTGAVTITANETKNYTIDNGVLTVGDPSLPQAYHLTFDKSSGLVNAGGPIYGGDATRNTVCLTRAETGTDSYNGEFDTDFYLWPDSVTSFLCTVEEGHTLDELELYPADAGTLSVLSKWNDDGTEGAIELSLTAPAILRVKPAAPVGSWKQNSVGWWYDNGDGTYPRNEWKQIGGVWYYFKSDGYMAANEWVGGYWLNANGAWTYQAKGSWRSNDKGWWYEDSTGWYPRNTWQKIDGQWYFFKANGYMAASEWYNGYWFGAFGAWTYQPLGSWQQNAVGWWFGDTSGWYAKNETLKINDVLYSFNAAGYWVQ